MDWETIKHWIFKVKRYKVKVVTANNGKTIQSFIAKSMKQGPKNRVFKLENDLKIKVSNELACVVEEIWVYDGKIVED